MSRICYGLYLTLKKGSKLGKKTWFCRSFFEVFRLRPPTPFVLRPNFLPNERCYSVRSYKLSNVSVGAESTIFGCFYVDFQELLPQMKSDFYRNLTSDVAQGNAPHMLRFFSKS